MEWTGPARSLLTLLRVVLGIFLFCLTSLLATFCLYQAFQLDSGPEQVWGHCVFVAVAQAFAVQAWAIWWILLFRKGASRKLLSILEELPSESSDFYSATIRHFHGRVRAQRNCGRFFVFFSTVAWTLVFVHWGRWIGFFMLPGFVFFAALGWGALGSAARISAVLHKADLNEDDPEGRLNWLRLAAISFRGDPISAIVLRRTEGNAHPS
jgi:hypothetical protein